MGEGVVCALFLGRPPVNPAIIGAMSGASILPLLLWFLARVISSGKELEPAGFRLRLGIAAALSSSVILWYLPDIFFSSDPASHPDIPQEVGPEFAIPFLIILAAISTTILTMIFTGRWTGRTRASVQLRHPAAVLAVMIVAWAAAGVFMDITKHHNLNVLGVNTIIADHALRNFVADQGFMYSPNAQTFGSSLIGVHANFIYVFIYPLYVLVPRYETIITLSTLSLALGAVPIYLLAKRHFSTNVSLILAASYLLHPTIIGQAASQDLTELRFAATPILFAFYFFETNRFLPFLGFSLLAMTVREDVAMFIAIFGILAFLRKRSIVWIAAPIFIGLSYFMLAVFSLIPHFNPTGKFARLELVYSTLGGNVQEILKTFVFQPWKVATLAFSSLKHIGFVVYLFASTGFFAPLFSAAILLSLPALGENLLHFSRPDIVWYYAILLIATLFPAYILGLSRIQQLSEKHGHDIFQFLVPAIIVLTLFSGTSMFYQWLSPAKFKARTNSQAIETLLDKLPDDASVVMPSYLLQKVKPSQAARFYNQVYYETFAGITRPEEKYFIIDTNIVSAQEARAGRETLEDLVSDGDRYTLICRQDNLSLYERRGEDGLS